MRISRCKFGDLKVGIPKMDTTFGIHLESLTRNHIFRAVINRKSLCIDSLGDIVCVNTNLKLFVPHWNSFRIFPKWIPILKVEHIRKSVGVNIRDFFVCQIVVFREILFGGSY